MFTLFRTEGWKELMGDLETQSSNIDSVRSTVDERDLNFRKGQLAILGTLFNLDTQISSSHQEALESNDDNVDQDEVI